MGPDSSALADHIADVPLIDQHVHGCWLAAGDRRRFENGLNEANTEPLADFDSGFDTQLGFAVRAHCAPLLGLPKHAEPQTYWQRRSQLTEAELAPLVSARGRGQRLAGRHRLSPRTSRTSAQLRRAVRQAALTRWSASSRWPSRPRRRPGTTRRHSRRSCAGARPRAVGTKSILAYRGGFDGDLTEPSAARGRRGGRRWRDRGGVRLTDRVLLRFGLHQALRLGKPLQFHVGFGDRDCDLHKANPLYLLDFLRQSGDTPIVLLHCYPYEREAGYLAQAFNNVYLDGGLSVNYLGARAPAFIARLLELAPFRKIVYSSDGFGPAELHYLGASAVAQRYSSSAERIRGRRRLESQADAMRVVDLIARGNAAPHLQPRCRG